MGRGGWAREARAVRSVRRGDKETSHYETNAGDAPSSVLRDLISSDCLPSFLFFGVFLFFRVFSAFLVFKRLPTLRDLLYIRIFMRVATTR
jgi:hypothetical protein